MTLRNTVPSDLPAIRDLWRRGFSDTPEEIKQFLTELYPLGCGFCAETDGRPVSFLCAIAQTAVCEKGEFNIAYLYGITTHPDFRGQGFCRTLLTHAETMLLSMGYVCAVLYPEEDFLREFYRKQGYSDLFNETKTVVPPTVGGTADPVDAIGYAGLRETLLYGKPHICYSLPLLRYQERTSSFYCLQQGTIMGCASARLAGNTLLVDEILPDASVLPALLCRFSCNLVRYRTVGSTTPFGMCKWLDGKSGTSRLSLGFPFD